MACRPGIVTVCTGRLCSGERVGLGFTSQASFTVAYGPGHAQVSMHIQPLRELLRPTGITTVLLDPVSCRQRMLIESPAAWARHGCRHPSGTGSPSCPLPVGPGPFSPLAAPFTTSSLPLHHFPARMLLANSPGPAVPWRAVRAGAGMKCVQEVT